MSSKRLLSSIAMYTLTGFAILNSWFFILFVCLLTAGGLYEFFYLIKKKDIPIYSYTGIFIGVLIPLTIFFQFELTKNWELLLIVCAFLMILLLQFNREDNTNATLGLSTTLFGVLYVSWFFSFLVKIRLLLPNDWEGAKLVAFIVIVTKMSDIGAMFFGTLFGKHPLLPKVSPNKSVEGTLGGLVVSSLAAVILKSFLPPLPQFTFWYVALMGAFFGSLGQLGDLSESLIKRDCKVKDSGSLLPGVGGVLDSIDSLLFSAPAFYLYMSSALIAIK
jgi:phosphatidate cytidylyltransferase